jgi:hypothetical protein
MQSTDGLLPIRPPICPDCLKPMRFVTSEAEKTHDILRHVLFVCDCGRSSDQLVADPKRMRSTSDDRLKRTSLN